MAAPKPRPPSREQVQREVDAIMRDVEDKRAKRSKQQQQLHEDMLSAIFKSVFEDTVPDSAVGIYSSGEKDRVGCTVPNSKVLYWVLCRHEEDRTAPREPTAKPQKKREILDTAALSCLDILLLEPAMPAMWPPAAFSKTCETYVSTSFFS